MKRFLAFLLTLILTFSILTGCTKAKVEEENTSEKTITVKDSRVKEVTINYPAKKIVCLLNSGLNDLYMLGAKDQVIGVDEWTFNTKDIYDITSQIDERVKNKTLPAVDKNVEKIVSMNPDVVVIWAGDKENIKALEDKGIKVVGIQVNNFDDVFWKMELLGKISGKETRAKEIIDYTKNELAKVNKNLENVEQKDKPKSIFVWGPTKLDFAGNNSTGDSILKMSKAVNAASDVNQEHFVASMEQAIIYNPDEIVMWNIKDLNPEDYYNDVQWKDISAVKNKKVIELPNAFYCDLWTVKYVESVKIVAKSLYPDLFKDVDIEKDKNEMLKFLYNVDFK